MIHLHRAQNKHPDLVAYASDIESRLETRQAEVVGSIDSEAVAGQLETVGFEPNPVVSNNRQPGPSVVALGMVVDRVLEYFGADSPTTDAFMDLILISDRYTDITDDLLDGDVPDQAVDEVMMTREIFVPLLVNSVSGLDEATVRYWTGETLHLAGVLFKEKRGEQSAAEYRQLIKQQAVLFTSITGAAAVQLDRPAEEIKQCETLGRCLFVFSQIVRDCESYVPTGEDPWNACELFTHSEIIELLRNQNEEFKAQSESLFDEQPRQVGQLLDVDLDTWKREVLDTT